MELSAVTPSRQSTDDDGSKQILDALCKALIATGGGGCSGRKRRRGRESKQQPDDEESGNHSQDKFELHSLWVHYNSNWKHSNSIFSIESGDESWDHRYGPPCITETLNLKESGLKHPVSLRFPPNVFRQANLDAFTNIVGRIRGRIKSLQEKIKKEIRIPHYLQSWSYMEAWAQSVCM